MKLKSIKPEERMQEALRGIAPVIPYDPRNISGDWSAYFGADEGQRYWRWDTDCCWAFAGVECVEDQLMYLWKTGAFTADDIAWFRSAGFIDASNEFYISRRYIPILSGVRDNGNDQANFWDLFAEFGAVPNAVLPYSVAQADAFQQQAQFEADYFNRAAVLQAMIDLGRQFLERVSVVAAEVGKRYTRRDYSQIEAVLKQSPLQIGIPVPQDGTWNRQKIKWDGRADADHSVELYKYDPVADPDFPYFIFDQYEPHLKQLSVDYYIPMITKGILNVVSRTPDAPVPVPATSLWARVWSAVQDFFDANPNWMRG